MKKLEKKKAPKFTKLSKLQQTAVKGGMNKSQLIDV